MKRILLLASLFVVFQISFAQEAKDLPSCKLKDLNGKAIDLQSYAKDGKITVISIWATWCAPCIKELTNINEIVEDWYADYDVEIVAISIDNARNTMKVKPLVNGRGWDYDVLLDVNQDTKRTLNYSNPPFTVLVDKNGKMVYRHTGYVDGDEYELEEQIKKIAR